MRKYAIGLAAATLIGSGMFNAQAGEVLIPYIKAGGNWVSLVSYAVGAPGYNGSNLHFVYWYKSDWDGYDKISDYLSAKCKEYNDEIPATKWDFTTVDVSAGNLLGLTNNVLGMAEGYDGGSAAPANSDFTLDPNSPVDAYLFIDDGSTAENDNLHAEAVVFDMVTGMFFYQYGIDIRGSVATNRFNSTTSAVMFQGEDFATTSVYYIPVNNADDAAAELEVNNKTACILPQTVHDDPAGSPRVYDRKEDGKSGLNGVCVTCLGLIPVKAFMSDSAWNKVKNGGGWFEIADGFATLTSTTAAGGGVTYKGEVYKIGTKPNIFAPLKSYENSLAHD